MQGGEGTTRGGLRVGLALNIWIFLCGSGSLLGTLCLGEEGGAELQVLWSGLGAAGHVSSLYLQGPRMLWEAA